MQNVKGGRTHITAKEVLMLSLRSSSLVNAMAMKLLRHKASAALQTLKIKLVTVSDGSMG